MNFALIISFIMGFIMMGDLIASAKLNNDTILRNNSINYCNGVCGVNTLILPGLAIILLALLAILLGLSRVWPRTVASTLLAALVCCCVLFVAFKPKSEPMPTYE